VSREWVLVAAAAVAFALPLLLAPYAPGGDTPWHAAVVAVMAEPDPARFLGAFQADGGFGSYVAVYQALAVLAGAVGAASAVQILVVLYVVGFVLAARQLAGAFGADGTLALLAAPAAYSTTLEFGFLVYLPALPLTLWLWALVRAVMQRGARPARMVALAAAWLGVSLCHPFAAAIAGLGAALLVLCDLDRPRLGRGALVGAVLVAGALPAVLALGSVASRGASIPGLDRASLWDRVTTQLFVPPLESLARAPAHLIGFAGEAWRYILVAVLGGAAIAWRVMAPPGPLGSSALSRRAPLYLALLLAVLYLATPFTFEWPRNWYGAQPRLLPLLWVAGLVALRPAPGSVPMRAAAVVASAAALSVLSLQSLLPGASEARDLAAVIARSAPSVRTLGLIEQPRTQDRAPPHRFRNATGWLVAERGGFASHLPIAARDGLNSGQHIPVRPADDAPPAPAGPPLGFARAFRWQRHAAGWDQFLLRDLDPARPHDYFAGHAAEVETVARAGRWRLVRRVE
jgi:hypothetical protein